MAQCDKRLFAAWEDSVPLGNAPRILPTMRTRRYFASGKLKAEVFI